MRVEIRKIGIRSLLFSAFPVAVFVVMLVSAFMAVFSPDATINAEYILSLVMQAIQGTVLMLVSAVFFLLAYNVLCGIGVRGVRVDLEDRE